MLRAGNMGDSIADVREMVTMAGIRAWEEALYVVDSSLLSEGFEREGDYKAETHALSRRPNSAQEIRDNMKKYRTGLRHVKSFGSM